eukprot:1225437-Pleurochrysis_carterae.AAC.1
MIEKGFELEKSKKVWTRKLLGKALKQAQKIAKLLISKKAMTASGARGFGKARIALEATNPKSRASEAAFKSRG